MASDRLKTYSLEKRPVRAINVEPIAILFSLFKYFSLYGPISSAFIYHKICVLQNAAEDNVDQFCDSLRLSNTSDARSKQLAVQVANSYFNEFSTVCATVPGILMSLSIGTWSDRYGRKPMMIYVLLGIVLSQTIAFFSSMFMYSPLWLLLFASFIEGCTGNILGILLLTASIIRDMCDEDCVKHLSIRLSVLVLCNNIGGVCGSLTSAFLIKDMTFGQVFLIGQFLIVLAFLYTVALLQETLPLKVPLYKSSQSEARLVEGEEFKSTERDTVTTSRATSRSMWSCIEALGLLDTLRTVFMPRTGSNRKQLIIGLLAFLIAIGADMGTKSFLLLFVKSPPLSWSDQLYVFYNAYYSALHAIGTVSLTVLLKRVFHAHDITLIAIGNASFILMFVVTAFSKTTLQMFTGRIYSAIALVENIGPLLAAFIFNNIYPLTLSVFPGLIFLLGAIILVLVLVLMLYLYQVARKSSASQLHDGSSKKFEEVSDTA